MKHRPAGSRSRETLSVRETQGRLSSGHGEDSSLPGWLAGVLLFFVLLVTVLVALRPVSDSDYWHHISLGRIVSVENRFPTVDELGSTAADRPWVSSGWAPSVLLYKLSGVPGGAQYYVAGLAVTVVVLLFGIAWRSARQNIAAAVVLLLLMSLAGYPRFLPRPDMFSMFLLVPLLLLLSWYDRKPPGATMRGYYRFLLVPALMLLWANCHMLFVIGLFIIGLYVVSVLWQNRGFSGYTWHRPVGLLLGSTGVAWGNPYGVQRTWWFIKENASLPDVSQRINELKPLWPVLAEPGGIVMMGLLFLWLVVCAWLLLVQKKQVGVAPWRWLTIGFLIVLAFVQRRQVGLATFGITALVIDGLRGVALPSWSRGKGATAIAGALAMVALALGLGGKLPMVPSWKENSTRLSINREWLPDEAIGFLRKNPPPARLFHDLYAGGFLGWHLAPTTRIFMDGRLEVFNNGTFDDFFAPMEGRMTVLDLFDKYDVRSVLLDWRSAAQQPGHTAAVLADSPAWQLCWFSDHYALFVRRGDAYALEHGYTYLNPLRPQEFMNALSNPATANHARQEAQRATRDTPDGQLARKAIEVSGG